MKLITLVLGIVVIKVAVAAAQSPAPQSKFEVASIKQNRDMPSATTLPRLGCHGKDAISDPGNPGLSDATIPIGRCVARFMTFKMLLAFAYRIPVLQFPLVISGGPAWLDSDRFDVEGKAEQVPIEAELRLMLRGLLAERFKLVTHIEPRELEIFTLVVASSGLKLKPSNEREECVSTSMLEPCGYLVGGPPRGLHGRRVPISAFTAPLTPWIRAVVEDGTGQKGLFDVSTTGWNVNENPGSPGYSADLPTLSEMLERQLGLRLKREKRIVDTIVIDHVERPTEN
jgi:uncharacterized protein (TIGR03435 family)